MKDHLFKYCATLFRNKPLPAKTIINRKFKRVQGAQAFQA